MLKAFKYHLSYYLFIFSLSLVACDDGDGNNNTRDTTAPTTPTVTSLITEDTSPAISGSFDSNDVAGGFTVEVNSVVYTMGLDPELTNTDNDWTLSIPPGNELTLGTYDIIATATDGSANTSTDVSSNELTIIDITAPTVNSTFPIPSTTNVARNTIVTATFDEDIFTTTVNGSSFILENDGSIGGTVSFDGATNIASFTPTSNLAMLTSYTATLTTAITDVSGNSLASNYTWSFTTEDGAWGSAELIEVNTEIAGYYPKVATDATGNAITVWQQFDGTQNSIYANRYVVGTGWGSPVLIETNNMGYADSQQIAVDDSGNAIAVWRQSNGSQENIWANRYVAGTGWGTAEQIDDNSWTGAPQIAVDANGNAIAVWVQSAGGQNSIYANRYIVGTGWGNPELIETINLGHAYTPQVAIDATGNAIAVWSLKDGIRHDIWANRYVVGTGWGSAELIETDNTGDASFPQIAVDTSGNAIAVWHQFDGIRNNIYANRYIVGTGWASVELIETDNAGYANYPQLAVDVNGNAIAVWRQYDGTRNNIWANRYVVDTGWGNAELIENDNAGLADSPQVTIDANGNAIAVWHQSDGTRTNIYANRYVVGTGWGSAYLIETNNAGAASTPYISVDTSGNAIAVWRQFDGSQYSTYANRFE